MCVCVYIVMNMLYYCVCVPFGKECSIRGMFMFSENGISHILVNFEDLLELFVDV